MIQVARRVVPLRVYDIEERRDSGKFGHQVIEQRTDCLAVILAKDHDDHHLARRGGADRDVAHQARMFAGIMERITLIEAELLDRLTNRIRGIALQVAVVDIEHLVKHARDVESEGRRSLQVGTRGHLLEGEPTAIGKGKFELVAVVARLGRGQTGANLGQGHLADARQLIAHLLGLEAQLLLVGQVLPLTSAADPEMGAEGLRAQGRTLHIAHHIPLHEAAALLANLHIHHIPRNGHRNKDHLLVPATHCLTLGCEGRNLQTL